MTPLPHETGLGKRRRRRPVGLRGRPLVSVVIPCYNYERYVGEAVMSVLDQEGVDTEVVVVDDNSTDGSREVVRAIDSEGDRVRLIEHPINLGPVETFNDGLSFVRGTYIVRLDADDILTPGSLARSIALLQAEPSVGLVYGHPLHFSSLPLPRPRATARRWVVWPGAVWLRERCRTGLNVITSPEVVMRASVVDAVGGQRSLAHTHDMEMWLRIASVSDVAYIEGADQAWHREHDWSLSQRIQVGRGDLVDRRDAFHVLFEWTESFLPETDDLRQLAERALANEALVGVVHMRDRGRMDRELERFLMDFADARDTGNEPLKYDWETRRLSTREVRKRTAPLRLSRALGRRLRNEVEFARWHRQGVFHRDGG